MPRKILKREHLTARVSAATRERIEAIAREEDRTISQTVGILVEQGLQVRKSQGKSA